MKSLPAWYSVLPALVALHCGSAPDAEPLSSNGGSTEMEPGSSAGSPPGGSTNSVGEQPPRPRPGAAMGANGSEELPSNIDGSSGANGSGDTPPVGTPAAMVDCSAATLAPGNGELTLEHDGVTREYLVHVPESYDGSSPVPLVVDMHGLTSSAAAQSRFGWREKADEEGFIVVHPQGLNASWNGGELCCGDSQSDGVDDEGFIRSLVEQMKRDACIDASRVYATGLSNGGAMSHLLACNAADVFAATAPVSMGNGAIPCEPSRPISVIMTRGTDDRLVPFDGGFLFPSAAEDFAQWAEVNGCSGEPEASADLCQTFSQCNGGVEVTLCTLDAGHVLYDNPQGFSVPDVVWETFERHTLP